MGQTRNDVMNGMSKFILVIAISAAYGCAVKERSGDSVDKIEPDLVSQYISLANEGDSNAQFMLALMYERGKKISLDYDKSFYWCKEAAKSGNADAQEKLAFLIMERVYMPEYKAESKHDIYRKGKYWLEKAANQDRPTAQHHLATMYYFGRGVDRDFEMAAEWYKKAADQGHASAQYNLSILYKDGNGVEKNNSLFNYWLKKSCDNGRVRSCENK